MAAAIEWNRIFVECTKPCWNAILRLAVSLTHARTEADDVLQATLLKGMKAFPQFVETHFGETDPEAARGLFAPHTPAFVHLRNWLLKIARNTYLDGKDKQSRLIFEGEHEAFESRENGGSASSPWDGAPVASLSGDRAAEAPDLTKQQQAFYRAALDDDWKEKLANLSDRQRSILFLAAEDYSYKEISNILNIPIGTVMSNLSRTLQKLKKS